MVLILKHMIKIDQICTTPQVNSELDWWFQPTHLKSIKASQIASDTGHLYNRGTRSSHYVYVETFSWLL